MGKHTKASSRSTASSLRAASEVAVTHAAASGPRHRRVAANTVRPIAFSGRSLPEAPGLARCVGRVGALAVALNAASTDAVMTFVTRYWVRG